MLAVTGGCHLAKHRRAVRSVQPRLRLRERLLQHRLELQLQPSQAGVVVPRLQGGGTVPAPVSVVLAV
jgi:hypothetical protein